MSGVNLLFYKSNLIIMIIFLGGGGGVGLGNGMI